MALGSDDTELGSIQHSLDYLKDSLTAGNDWLDVMLETFALWTVPEEEYQGRKYVYLIGGEAFDWIELAQRLSIEMNDYAPKKAIREMLDKGRFPSDLTLIDFKKLMGLQKYRGYLNYWYGITVEQAILKAVEAEVSKEQRSKGIRPRNVTRTAFSRLYRLSRSDLIEKFLIDRPNFRSSLLNRVVQSKINNSVEHKEFTYWLFKFRLRTSEPAKLASDTKKGMEMLEQSDGNWVGSFRPSYCFLW